MHEEPCLKENHSLQEEKSSSTLARAHTQEEAARPFAAPGVRVRSKFSLPECRRYAEHLKAKGEGITNPGGFAMSIYRSGEVDAQIEQWLRPESAPRKLDARDCPDCSGRGVRYVDPANFDRGVTPCRHEKLAQQVAVGVG